jgi:hypothetical protein
MGLLHDGAHGDVVDREIHKGRIQSAFLEGEIAY